MKRLRSRTRHRQPLLEEDRARPPEIGLLSAPLERVSRRSRAGASGPEAFALEILGRGRLRPAPGRPSLRIRTRPDLRAVLLVVAVLAFFAWISLPHDTHWSGALEAFHRQVPGRWWNLISSIGVFGKGGILVLVTLSLSAAGYRRRATAALCALLIVGAVVPVVKSAVGRERPSGTNMASFPSGDTAAAVAYAVGATPWSPVPVAVAAVIAGSVGTLRVFEGDHYPSDVFAGAAIGLLAGALARRWTPRSLTRLAGRVKRRSYLGAAMIGCLFWSWVGGGKVPWELMRFLTLAAPPLVLLLLARFVRRRSAAVRLSWLARIPTSRKAALAGALGVLLALLVVASASTLWDRDEPRFAQATVEMGRSGSALVPTFNGHLRPDKPILIYWLMALPVALAGPREVAVRFWAPCGIAVACLLTWILGRRLLSERAAPLAALVLVATPLTLVTGSAATTDAVLLAWLTLTMTAFAGGWLSGFRASHLVVLGVALGGAMLTKGPVGLALPLLSIGAACWIAGRDVPLGRRDVLGLALATLGGIALFLLWAIPANLETGGEFARLGLGRHVLQRSVQPLEGHGGSPLVMLPYYPLVMLIAFLPWTPYLGGAISAVAGGRIGGARGRSLLLGWLVATPILMTLVATKLPHYVLPVWPALALLVAGTIRAGLRGELTARDRLWLRRGVWWAAPGGAVVVLGLLIGPGLLPKTLSLVPFVALALLIATALVRGLRAHRAERHAEAFVTFMAGSLLGGALLVAGVLPELETLKVPPRLAEAIRAGTAEEVAVATYGYFEPSLVFYLRRWPVRQLSGPEAVATWAREPGPGVLVLPAADGRRLLSEGPTLEILARASGFNFSNGKPVDLVALGRGVAAAPPPLPKDGQRRSAVGSARPER